MLAEQRPGRRIVENIYTDTVRKELVKGYFFAKKDPSYQVIGMIGNLSVAISTSHRSPVIHRSANMLIFPYTTDGNFSVLQQGKKCLFFIPKSESQWRSELWFAGTDDGSNFLTEIELRLYDTFRIFGENAFFEALKPELTEGIERHFNIPPRRQGDMFVSIFPYTQDNCSRFAIPYLNNFKYDTSFQKKKRNVFNTRHEFSGQYYEVSHNVVLAANGVLEAPNHPTMQINDVHIIQQNKGLVQPQSAD
ncbi:MAG: hypothetical protein HY445_00200 [Candidatus Niyogibacteria bacterium]|nr:hypothetical protein [Candidatus Niyogibacteria bacterium]